MSGIRTVIVTSLLVKTLPQKTVKWKERKSTAPYDTTEQLHQPRTKLWIPQVKNSLLDKLRFVISVVAAEGGKYCQPMWETMRSSGEPGHLTTINSRGRPEPKWLSHHSFLPSRGWPTCFPQILPGVLPTTSQNSGSPQARTHTPNFSPIHATSPLFSKHISRAEPLMEIFTVCLRL